MRSVGVMRKAYTHSPERLGRLVGGASLEVDVVVLPISDDINRLVRSVGVIREFRVGLSTVPLNRVPFHAPFLDCRGNRRNASMISWSRDR